MAKSVEQTMIPGMNCLVCKNPEADLIDSRLLNGVSQSAVGIEFGISSDTVRRHWNQHVLKGVSEGGTPITLTLRDVADIPIQMKERREILQAMIRLCLEPATRRSPMRHAGIDHVNTAFLLGAMRLMQRDEETILRITGILKDGDAKADLIVTDQYQMITKAIDARLRETAGGDDEQAALARQILSDAMMPIEEILGRPDPYKNIETEYVDLGPK